MLNRDVSLLPMPVTPPGQPVFVYGVIVHNTGALPPPAAGTNHPSSRTPSDIFTAISWQPAADAGAAPTARNASTTNGRPLRSPIARSYVSPYRPAQIQHEPGGHSPRCGHVAGDGWLHGLREAGDARDRTGRALARRRSARPAARRVLQRLRRRGLERS